MDKILPVDIPPGVLGNATEYESKGRWIRADLIRWYEGFMRPVGGWQRFTSTPLAEPARGILSWRRIDALPRIAFGTASHLYWSDGSVINEITPTGYTPGFVDQGAGIGYGTGPYSAETYGTPRPAGSGTGPATSWSLDSFGDILLALANTDGKLYSWDPMASPATATVVAAAPTGAAAMFVTDDRMCVMIGASGQPNEIQWCHQGDFTNWTVSESTTAGDLQLNTHGQAIAGTRMLGTNLIWTDADVHTFTYEGYPFIYGVQRAGSNCGLLGPKAFVSTLNMAAWMGPEGFFMYNGLVQPLKCDVARLAFDNLNTAQQSKVYCGMNSQFSEIWWFFPSLNSTENDSYVFWNYKSNHWGVGIGVFGRTAWVDREVWPFPIACGADNNMYEQENGWTAAGASRNGQIVAVSGPIDIGTGDNIMAVNQLLADTNVGAGSLIFSALTKYTPNGVETTSGPYPMRADGYTDVRFNGRQMKMSLSQNADGLWQFGVMRMLATIEGQR